MFDHDMRTTNLTAAAGRPMAGWPNAEVVVEQAYAQHGSALFNFCARMTGQPALAEDVVQETFIRLLSSWQKIHDAAHLKRWLFRTASNLAISAARKRAVRVRAAAWLMGQATVESPDLSLGGEVQRGLMALGAAQREVLVLHDVVGMTQREIATLRGAPLGTVQSQLRRARIRLGQLLEGQDAV